MADSIFALKKYILIIPDGAADNGLVDGRSPLAEARIPYTDRLARDGVTGRMQTLYADLPRGSLVAQLGMLGWEPHLHFPLGRASCELLASNDISLNDGDIALRANFVRIEGRRLASYNAGYIHSEQALLLVDKVRAATREAFPDFELYHGSDFRNTLVVRSAGIDPRCLDCPEPHESEGEELDLDDLVKARQGSAGALARRINSYMMKVREVLEDQPANLLLPWSASRTFHLPSFAANTGFEGRAAVVGCVEFLQGIAKAGQLEFLKVGNGRPDTDYEGKGRAVLELLADGCVFVICHINGPDEASHMGNRQLKIHCLEQIDRYLVRPVVEYFDRHPGELGGVMVVPDHYTNYAVMRENSLRAEAHSIDPVPFALWNGRDRDSTSCFTEQAAMAGRYDRPPVNHLRLLEILGVTDSVRGPASADGRSPREEVKMGAGRRVTG